MKKKIFIAAAVIMSITAEAQDSTRLLNEVVVTATKFPLKTTATGKVLSILTKEQLEQSGGKDLAQIINDETGILINGSNSNTGKDKSIYLRGARVEHTLITIDGVPVYDPSGIGSNFDIRNISINNIERVEILKGSQSTLYGSDAIAGVINIITKKGADKPVNINGLFSAGSNDNFRSNLGLSGKKDKIDYSVNYSNALTGGINEAASPSPVVDRDEYKQHSLQANVGIQVTNKIRIAPYFRFTNSDGDLDQGAFIDELDYTYTQKSVQAGIKNEVDLGKAKLTVLYNYNRVSRTYIDDSVKSQNGFDAYSKGEYSGNENFLEAYVTANLNKEIKLTGGVDYRNSKSNQSYNSIGFFGPFSTKYADDSLNQNQIGIYAAVNLAKENGFNIELGNRLNIHSEYGSHYVFNINPSYFIKNKVKLFANISSGYRTPSLYQLFSEYGNTDLKPEASMNLEGGVQFFNSKNTFNGRVVGFGRTVKNLIAFYTDPNTYESFYINQDKQKDYGFELDANYTGIKNTTIKAFYTYVDGKLNTKTGAGKDTSFFNLVRRPNNSFGLTISNRLTKRLLVSTNLTAFGKREDRYFDAVNFNTVQVTLKSYTLWNIYAQYGLMNNRLNLFLDLRNITDSKYTEVSGFNTLGFNMYGGLRFNL